MNEEVMLEKISRYELKKFMMLDERRKHLDFYENYQNILKETALLFKELGIVNPLNICTVYEYLVWNGYFSKHKDFQFNDSRILFPDLLGSVIMTGQGVCINIANLEKDILSELGFPTYSIRCFVSGNLKKNKYEPPISLKRAKKTNSYYKRIKNFFAFYTKYKTGNHAINLIKTSNGYILSDPTNLDFLNYQPKFQAKYVNFINTIKIMNPCFDFDEFSTTEFINVISELNTKGNYFLTLEMIKAIYEESLEICQNNLSLINDFYDNNQKDIDVVLTKLVQYKKQH